MNNSKKSGAVLVVGGGIAGIQSSLDLADSGYKVYLVEETPAIGGIMAQLDKTFPTNDCAMCTMSPKLVDCGRHPNIEIITNADIESLRGEVGNFTVAVKRRPRYVDSAKCTGCGDCIEACPVTKEIYEIERPPIIMEKDDLNRIRAIMSEYIMEESSIIPILQDINDKFRYLPGDILEYVSRQMDIPLSTIYRIATFYNAFSLSPRGRYEIKICMGTACYIKGAAQIMESFERELGIKEGQTTDDLRFGLEAISCFGCCGSAPVVVVNDDMHGYFKTSQVPKIIQKYKKMDS